jgi:hypothetical protein
MDSYLSIFHVFIKNTKKAHSMNEPFEADWTGLEPATPCVTGRYSNQLNYQSFFLAETTPSNCDANVERFI